ncbi:MAG: TIGR01212 family radical SAM protein [Bacteroidales bacterium]|nr:TIGR01212 family radical SAM protein [Bacteroidales bacterium]
MCDSTTRFPWGDHRRFNSYKRFLGARFGTRIQKLTIDAGFSCPNRDGTVGTGGCTYCLNAAFNPSYCSPLKSVSQQLDEGIEFHHNRYRRAGAYLAYFQAFSNTHAPLSDLKRIYAPAINRPDIKGIVIGTRPDCVDNEKLDYFAELSQKMFVSIEYGVESCNDMTLQRINRGHTFSQAVKAIDETRKRDIHTGAHFIFGLPGETVEDWMNAIHIINMLPINSIKFHQLQIIKGTLMEDEYKSKQSDFHHFTMGSYISFITDFTEKLNPEFVIERFAGEVPPRFLSVNNWGTQRYDVVLNKIEQLLEARDSWQGKYFQK